MPPKFPRHAHQSKKSNRPHSHTGHKQHLEGSVSKNFNNVVLHRMGKYTRFDNNDGQLLGDKDKVVAAISHGVRRWARLQRIVNRHRTIFPAVTVRRQKKTVLEPLVNHQPAEYLYDGSDATAEAKDTLVLAEVQRHPKSLSDAKMAKIRNVICRTNDPKAPTSLALACFEIPHEWPEEVNRECKQLQAQNDALIAADQREDLRARKFVTIDGDTARDFDDAVWCRTLPDGGGWQLQVAIADVSAYVQSGSPLDREAAKRGTSVYFEDRVIPMLPDLLSTNLCSLKPHEDRPAVLCDMTINTEGEIQSHHFSRALIRSAARLTYRRIEPALAHDDWRDSQAQQLQEELKAFRDATMALKHQRNEQGALSLHMPELHINLSAAGHPESCTQNKQLLSQLCIEHAMIAANSCAAATLHAANQPAPMRICGQPEQGKWDELLELLSKLNFASPGAHPTREAYNRLLRQLDGRDDELMIKQKVQSTLTRAIYAVDEKTGHFPMALSLYANFTSPIRRYPDLMIHRLLLEDKKALSLKRKQLEKICEQCSDTNQRAKEAGFQVQRHRQCLLSEQYIGQWQPAWVSRIFASGIEIYLSDLQLSAWMSEQELNRHYCINSEAKTLQPVTGRDTALSMLSPVEVQIGAVRAEKQEIILSHLRPAAS